MSQRNAVFRCTGAGTLDLNHHHLATQALRDCSTFRSTMRVVSALLAFALCLAQGVAFTPAARPAAAARRLAPLYDKVLTNGRARLTDNSPTTTRKDCSCSKTKCLQRQRNPSTHQLIAERASLRSCVVQVPTKGLGAVIDRLGSIDPTKPRLSPGSEMRIRANARKAGKPLPPLTRGAPAPDFMKVVRRSFVC